MPSFSRACPESDEGRGRPKAGVVALWTDRLRPQQGRSIMTLKSRIFVFMLSGTLEQLKQPPAEAAEPVSKAEKIDRPLGVAEPVEQSFSGRAKEIAANLSAESKGFIGKLYEGIKSSEIVQNLADRYQVWRNEGLARRAQGKIDKFQSQQKTENEAAERASKNAAGVEGTLAEMENIRKGMGQEVSAEDKAKIENSVVEHNARAEEAKMRAGLLSGRMSEVKGEIENFEARVAASRGHLDGRLAAKQEANNRTLAEYKEQEEKVKRDLESNKTQIEALNGSIKKFEVLLAGVSDKASREVLQKNINELAAKRGEMEKAEQEILDKYEEVHKRKNELQEKNTDIQAKRGRIFPSKEKSAVAEQPGDKPKSVVIKADGKKAVVDYGGGKEAVVSGGQVREISPDGNITVKPISGAGGDIMRYFGGRPRDELEMMGFPQDEIERMEKAKEERPPFLAGDLIAEWNKKYGQQFGLALKLEKYADAANDLQTEYAAKEFISQRLAKTLNADRLAQGWKKDVNRFFAERKATEPAP